MAADSWKKGTGRIPFRQQPEGHWVMLNYWEGGYGYYTYRGIQVPVDADGLPLGWITSVRTGTDPEGRGQWESRQYAMEWRPKYTFRRSLRAIRAEKGRAASNIILADVMGNEFTMTADEFVEATHRGADSEGYIRANWTFTKKGANYFLILDPDQTPPEGED